MEWIDTDSPYPRYLRVAESTLGDAYFLQPRVDVAKQRVDRRNLRRRCRRYRPIPIGCRRRFRDEREDRKKKVGVRSSRSLYETSNERVPKAEVCRVRTRVARETRVFRFSI